MTLEQQAREDRIVRLAEEALGNAAAFELRATTFTRRELDAVPWVPLSARLTKHDIGVSQIAGTCTGMVDVYRTR